MPLAAAPLLPAVAADSVQPWIDPTDHLAVAKARALLVPRQDKVLRELALLSDRAGQVQVSQADLAKATRLSMRTIRMACKELADAGWITRTPKSNGAAGRVPDLYTLNPAPMPAANH